MIRVSTHVLDTARGSPAAGIAVTLEAAEPNGTWTEVGRGVTDVDGRLSFADAVAPGDYRLRFATGDYHGATAFYPEVVVCVRLGGVSKYHLPLLLNPFGYSTYRGS